MARSAKPPRPLVPADCTMAGYPAMLLDIVRLRQSDFDATQDDTAWRAGVNLWLSAYQSVPAGSLQDGDAALAKAAQLGRDLKTWKRVRKAAMQGFVLCADGRQYHQVVCVTVLGTWIDKLTRRYAGAKGNRGSLSEEARQSELRAIERKIGEAHACLAALDPHHPALLKSSRILAQCGAQSDGNAGAMPPQYNRMECNEEGKSPSQDGAEVIQLGAAREAAA